MKSAFKSFFSQVETGKRCINELLDGKKYAIINVDEIEDWNHSLAHELMNKAVKYGVKILIEALDESFYEASGINATDIEIGFVGECISLVKGHEIASEHIGKLIRVKGIVDQTHFIKPMAIEVVFKCRECGALTHGILQESPFVLTNPPRKCDACDERVQYDIVEEMSTYIDSQEFTIQESFEDVSGRIPQRVKMITFKKYLINRVYCGDLVEIVGIVRLAPTYRKGRKSRFNIPYIEVYAINKHSKDPEAIEISLAEEQEIISLSKKPDVYNKLINALAPSLYGMDKCKEGCLLAMVGGVTKPKKDITVRGSIHILIVGDPSTAKSQLLKTVADLSPRGLYSSGQGVSGVGLTAALKKDTDGEWTINAGVLVLADKGVACIDEIDKMRSEDRINIHEAMAQQTVTISKAGLHNILRARTAVIAAANPALGRYDQSKSVFENLSKFPPTLFSRFDLIFTLIDIPEDEKDKNVLKRIENDAVDDGVINRDLFKKYIAYAKTVNPQLIQAAKDKLGDYFLSIRKQMRKNNDGDRIPITYRQYEALVRLCEAHARILLKKEAGLEDAEVAIKIFEQFLKDIDFDIEELSEGKPKTRRDAAELVYDIIKKHQTVDGIPYMDVINRSLDHNLTKDKAVRAITDLTNEGMIFQTSAEPDLRYRTSN